MIKPDHVIFWKKIVISLIFTSFSIIVSRRKQKNTLDGLNNNIELGYSSLANISKLTQLEEDKFRQLQEDISETSGRIQKLGKRLINT